MPEAEGAEAPGSDSDTALCVSVVSASRRQTDRERSERVSTFVFRFFSRNLSFLTGGRRARAPIPHNTKRRRSVNEVETLSWVSALLWQPPSGRE